MKNHYQNFEKELSVKGETKRYLCTRYLEVGDTNIVSYMYKHGHLLMPIHFGWTFDKILPNGRGSFIEGKSSMSSSFNQGDHPYVDELHGFEGDKFRIIREI